MKTKWSGCLVSVLLAVSGCASVKPVDPKDETLSLVYGYFDMADAPSKLEWVSIKQYDKKGGDDAYYSLAVNEGLFFHVGMEPGSYQVHKFGGMGGIPLLTRRPFEYDFGSKGRNETALRIPKPGIYYVGTYKYIDHSGGLFQADRFEMKRVAQPNEKQILERVIKALETDKELSGYTRQLALARRRLAEL